MNRRELQAQVDLLTRANSDLTARLETAAESLLAAQKARDNANAAVRLQADVSAELRCKVVELTGKLQAARKELGCVSRLLAASEMALRAERKVHLELECTDAEIDALFEARKKDQP